MRILLITPPMLQFNTPYPATPYLTGFLTERGYDVVQADAALLMLLQIFSRVGLLQIKDELKKKGAHGPQAQHFLGAFDEYIKTVEPVVGFLQNKNPTLAYRIVTRAYLPEGSRFQPLQQYDLLASSFGEMGISDKAKYLASLYLDDIADMIKESIDPRFEFSRYAERLASCQPSFDVLEHALTQPASLIDRILEGISQDLITTHRPDIAGWTVPFPGNVYGAFRMARTFATHSPQTQRLLGGGYVNTELRSLSEPRVFDYFDFITLDDGEQPLLSILDHLKGQRPQTELLRTYVRVDNRVRFISNPGLQDISFRDTGTPDYAGLPLTDYVSMFEMLNPVYRLWSDHRWNKMVLAHGCYWNKCTFCDTSLDYIKRYEPDRVDAVLNRMIRISEATKETGFHFVDEAAPPALLKALSEKIIENRLNFTWWGNIRFEKMFDSDLPRLMAEAGCVAVTGGLEVASDRLLKLINKGVTIEQVARVTRTFRKSGIFVHAYLMYGFPSQTVQETVDSLEVVRQLFQSECLKSAYWHRFAATVHSPVGKNPDAFGIRLLSEPSKVNAPLFAINDVPFEDSVSVDHDMLGEGLRMALYNYMHGKFIDADVREWFEVEVPKPKVKKSLIREALRS